MAKGINPTKSKLTATQKNAETRTDSAFKKIKSVTLEKVDKLIADRKLPQAQASLFKKKIERKLEKLEKKTAKKRAKDDETWETTTDKDFSKFFGGKTQI